MGQLSKRKGSGEKRNEVGMRRETGYAQNNYNQVISKSKQDHYNLFMQDGEMAQSSGCS